LTLEVVLLGKRLEWSKDFWIIFAQFRENLLAMFHLHKGWLKRLNGVQNLSFQIFILNHIECLLKHIVAKLVIDQALDDKLNSGFKNLGVTQCLEQLFIVVWESSFEDSVDVMVTTTEALLNDVGRELELGQTDEVFGDLLEDQLIFALVTKLQDVLDQVVAIWVLN
jgi:hypothetical protein